MKNKFHSLALIFFLFLLISSSTSAARLLSSKEGQHVQPNQTTEGNLFQQEDDSVDKLMDIEACGHEDEECWKRRMDLEAHLDYIYTQRLHNKP
ncbi:putative phytosulfokines 6 [Drosera capensis]